MSKALTLFIIIFIYACQSKSTFKFDQRYFKPINTTNKREEIAKIIKNLREEYQSRCLSPYREGKIKFAMDSHIKITEKLQKQIMTQSSLYCRCLAYKIEDSNYFKNKLYEAKISDDYKSILIQAHATRAKFPEITFEKEICEKQSHMK